MSQTYHSLYYFLQIAFLAVIAIMAGVMWWMVLAHQRDAHRKRVADKKALPVQTL